MWSPKVLFCLSLSILLIVSFNLQLHSYFRISFWIPLRSNASISSSSVKKIDHVAIILTRRISTRVLQHFLVLTRAGVKTFVMCDERPVNFTNFTDRIVYVDDESVAQYGLKRNRVWDRVFVWLYNQSVIDYVWIMEDDLTWVHVQDMINLFDKYAYDHTDLLSRNIIFHVNHTRYWMWWPKNPLDVFPQKKWSGALNMLSRVSHRLVEAHRYYALQLHNQMKQNSSITFEGNVYFQEFFIPTVSQMFNLTLKIYDHSKMDVHVFALKEEAIGRSLKEGKRIFHPVKHDSALLSNATQ